MRQLAIALVAVMLAGLGVFAPASVPAASAAPVNPKVAIIVGATHSATSKYRSYGDELYNEAIKYTSNVVKVYSPNATWSAVKAAVNGASVVIYLGHGNGWPSPYTYDPDYTTKNGFGLNSSAGAGDNNTKYYGEPYIRTLTPAPNAVVLLFHLCYASGNSEPGHPDPTLSVARQRVDNYGAGFLGMGAKAVIADGHSHSPYYLWALFATKQSIDSLWRGAPSFNGNVQGYPSVRTPGMTYQMDPDGPGGGYYRSIVGKMDLSTELVTGASYADTGSDPSTFVVPGRASAAADGAPVYPSAAAAAAGTGAKATLPYDTRVRIGWQEGTTLDGTPVYFVRTFDNAVDGWMTATSLTPRDSQGPKVWGVDDGTGAFSPNGDGSQDVYTGRVQLSEDADWTIRVVRDGTTYAENAGSDDTATIDWDGLVDGSAVPDGTYRWEVRARDDWQNAELAASGPIVVDTLAPTLSASAATSTVPTFSPNGDGWKDQVAFAASMSEPGLVEAAFRSAGGDVVGTSSALAAGGTTSITWDGRSKSGAVAPDGTYTVQLAPRDRAGNVGPVQETSVALYASLGFVTSSASIFFPQDGDSLAARTTFSMTLRSPATVTWAVVNAAGQPVRTIRSNEAMAAGTHTFSWDGRTDSGSFAPRSTYRSYVVATNGSESSSQSASVIANAFRITVSDTTPVRRQRITITALSAENLSANPRLTVYQPGLTPWSVAMTKVGTRLYRVTITLKSSGTGTLKLRVLGKDTAYRSQSTTISMPLK